MKLFGAAKTVAAKRFVTVPGCCESVEKIAVEPHKQNDLLALRGWLAYGMLKHCLQKRHKAQYGVARPGKKRIAIPFHASNTPAQRAEFGHPDCALAFSCLSYYYDGLSMPEVIQALETMMNLGFNARKSIYQKWYEESKGGVLEYDREKMDRIEKIDLSNAVQRELLAKHYRFNMHTINFWLNECVFPTETMQYPHRLVATAWNLADNAKHMVAGFSGTKDLELLMPLQVRPVRPTDPVLLATDGKMLALLLKHASYATFERAHEKELWESFLDYIVDVTKQEKDRLTSAFIDAGALMAGASNAGVAKYLIGKLSKTFRGVIFFDGESLSKGWYVLDRNGSTKPRHSSPIHERDAFVYYDESRCRGADMKLRPTDGAILSLGPKMSKDKLNQAAARLRMLEFGQKLRIVGTPEITAKIQKSTSGAGASTVVAGASDSGAGAGAGAAAERGRERGEKSPQGTSVLGRVCAIALPLLLPLTLAALVFTAASKSACCFWF
jgi:hypothetical protein